MKPIVFALILPTLAACGQDGPQRTPSNGAVTVQITEPSTPAPPSNAQKPIQEPQPAPVAVPQARFAGLWAVDAAGCKSPPWNFTVRDLTTKGEVYCSFKRVEPVAGGYDIATLCSAAGDEVSETMRLRLKDADKRMTVSSDQTYKPIDLMRCDS